MAPTNTFTVTNSFNTNNFGEVGLATGTKPLIQPTDVADFGTPEAAAVAADNLARGVVLDDGAAINFLEDATTKAIPLPWLTKATPVRVGAKATFPAVTTAATTDGVILDFRNNNWKFQPQQQVTNTGATVATFANTRNANLAPRTVGGDISLATFNVLNYFNTTGEEWVSSGRGTCTYFTDRAGTPIANNACAPDGPRGAATTVSLNRQQAKIVTAINTLDADIVSLEEIENSVKLGEPRDDASGRPGRPRSTPPPAAPGGPTRPPRARRTCRRSRTRT